MHTYITKQQKQLVPLGTCSITGGLQQLRFGCVAFRAAGRAFPFQQDPHEVARGIDRWLGRSYTEQLRYPYGVWYPPKIVNLGIVARVNTRPMVDITVCEGLFDQLIPRRGILRRCRP